VRHFTKRPVDREEGNLIVDELTALVRRSAPLSSVPDIEALKAAVAALQAQAGKAIFTPDIWNAIKALIDEAIAAMPMPPIQPDEQAQIWFAEEA